MFHDHTGAIAGLLGIFFDITDRKQSERALAESERKFRTLSEQSPNMIFIQGAQHTLYVNRRCEELLGYTLEEFYADDFDFRRLIAPESMAAVEADFAQFVRGGAPVACELVLLTRDGRRIPAWHEPRTVYFEGQPALMGIDTDITELKRLEEQLRQAQKLEAIAVLTGGIAHDFNNLLMPIIGYAEMLLDTETTHARQQRYASNILTAAQRAKALVRQLLTFGQPQASEVSLVDLRESVAEALRLLRHALPSTIQIVTEFDPECGSVLAEAAQILQIIMNLCTNAYQAIGDAQGTLWMRVQSCAAPCPEVPAAANAATRHWVRLQVADTGAGMDTATQQRIFEPFFTTKEVGKGTGLGLPVVYGIVQHLGGHIAITSAPGQGSTFSIYLPVTPVASEPAEPVTALVHQGVGRILLVDDDEAVLQVTQAMLQQAGYDVTACQSGIEALAALAETQDEYLLLLTDQVMPGMTGDELAGRAAVLRPTLPVILMTGLNMTSSPAQVAASGIHHTLSKPITRGALFAALVQLQLQGDAERG